MEFLDWLAGQSHAVHRAVFGPQAPAVFSGANVNTDLKVPSMQAPQPGILSPFLVSRPPIRQGSGEPGSPEASMDQIKNSFRLSFPTCKMGTGPVTSPCKELFHF